MANNSGLLDRGSCDEIKEISQKLIKAISCFLLNIVNTGTETSDHLQICANGSSLPLDRFYNRTAPTHGFDSMHKPFMISNSTSDIKLDAFESLKILDSISELSKNLFDLLSLKDDRSFESRDQRILRQAIEVVENNMSSPSFDVAKMAIEIGMSRTNMHRRLKEVAHVSPGDLIRKIRLRRAALLLMRQNDSVARISFAVGFEDQSYFAKVFKKQFGVLPSEYSRWTAN